MEKKHKSHKNISIRDYLIIHGKIVKDSPPTGNGHTSSDNSEKCGASLKQPTLNHFITKMKKQHRRRATTPAKTGVPVSLVTRGVRKKASSDDSQVQLQGNKGKQCLKGQGPSSSRVLCAVDTNLQPNPMVCGSDIKLSREDEEIGGEMIDNQQSPSTSAHDRLEHDLQAKARVSDHATTSIRTDKENCGEYPEAIPRDCHGGMPKTFHKDREIVSGSCRKPLNSAKSARRSRLKLNRRPKAARSGRVPSSRPETTVIPVIDEIPSREERIDGVSLPPPKQHTPPPSSLPKDQRINYTDTEELLAELSYCEKIKL